MKNINLKDKIIFGVISILIILLMLSNCENGKIQKDLYEQMRENNRQLVQNSKLIKEKDGQYSKFVDNFNTQKDLLNQLKSENEELYKVIKKNDEKLLSITNTIISLKKEVVEGFGKFNPKDSNLINLSLKYPTNDDWFIRWDGTIHKKTAYYKGEFNFGKLPLKIVMTEISKGIWNSRLIGPKWLLVDSIQVEALDPKEYNNSPTINILDERNTGFILGGGFIKSFINTTPNSLSIGMGAYFKNHSLILNGTTNMSVGLNYYYRFITYKKKK